MYIALTLFLGPGMMVRGRAEWPPVIYTVSGIDRFLSAKFPALKRPRDLQMPAPPHALHLLLANYLPTPHAISERCDFPIS